MASISEVLHQSETTENYYRARYEFRDPQHIEPRSQPLSHPPPNEDSIRNHMTFPLPKFTTKFTKFPVIPASPFKPVSASDPNVLKCSSPRPYRNLNADNDHSKRVFPSTTKKSFPFGSDTQNPIDRSTESSFYRPSQYFHSLKNRNVSTASPQPPPRTTPENLPKSSDVPIVDPRLAKKTLQEIEPRASQQYQTSPMNSTIMKSMSATSACQSLSAKPTNRDELHTPSSNAPFTKKLPQAAARFSEAGVPSDSNKENQIQKPKIARGYSNGVSEIPNYKPTSLPHQNRSNSTTDPQKQFHGLERRRESQKGSATYDSQANISKTSFGWQHQKLQPMSTTESRIGEAQPNATMEAQVAGKGQPKRVGRWTLAQLRQTDGIIPSQAGWNKGDSQKLMTNFGTPRNTQTRVKAENLQEVPEEILRRSDGQVRLQSGTNKFESQRGMTGFGSGRDVCREGIRVNTAPTDLPALPEEKIRLSDGIVRLQAGTNKYDSQKGMTGFGTSRRETTKMLDSKHPEYDHERPDQSEIPLQAGTNKFASQKGMTNFGTSRRETTKILDSAHPEYNPESSIDATTIPSQMGSNRYASQKGMTGFGQPRWEVLDPSISWQNRKSQGMVRLQSGTNRFASQQGMTGFGTIRNTTYEAENGELPWEDMKRSETIIPSQAGWNKGDSQKGMSFGAPRDVKGKHLKRIWELEYPEEAEASLDRL
ncbi:hypothetical protein AB6A40_006533 [Gnathostoma spinigerum]|uniref:Uncharacterized protein n=1 Tax=Gnathostoma spinigerum TaxID=75299 RepID=A0ABD6ENU5_9BILA